jgi:hypothetical protein
MVTDVLSLVSSVLFFDFVYWFELLLSFSLVFIWLMNFAGKPFVGASIGYFSFIFLLTGRALTVSFGTC